MDQLVGIAAGVGLYTPERLTRYRVHGGNLSGQKRYLQAKLFCYDVFLADQRIRSIHPALRRERASVQTSTGIALLAGGRRREALAYLSADACGVRKLAGSWRSHRFRVTRRRS
jgi:hypothetical protein